MQPKISGTFTVLITPFDKNGQLDVEGFRQNIRYQVSHGIDGIVVLGTTGEAPTLSHAEKEYIMRIAREESYRKCHFMVGTGSYSTQQTIENTQAAKDAGADSVLVIAPYYNRPTQEGLFQHYEALAKAIDIPIIIYNHPIRTGQNLQTETLKRLAIIENIVGVKESSGNVLQIMEVIENILPIRPDFSIMSGDDILTYPLITLGGHGIFSVLGNLLPQQVKNLCDVALTGDFSQARNLHYELLPYFRSIFIETNPIPIKTAMNLMNFPAGPCRLPLCEMNSTNVEKLKDILSVLCTNV